MVAIQEQLLAAVGDRRGVGAADRLCEVSTAVPAPESLRSIKARNAVNKRWHPNAG
jgi:hypothetical protein